MKRVVPAIKGQWQTLVRWDATLQSILFFFYPALNQGCTGLVHQDQLDKLILILMIGRRNEQKQLGV